MTKLDRRISRLLSEVQATWERTPSGWRPRRDERVIFIAGSWWRVTRTGESTELQRPVATVLLEAIETQESDQSSRLRIWRLPAGRRPRRSGPMPRRQPRLEQHLTIREVAQRLSVHPATVRKWLASGIVTVTTISPPGAQRSRRRIPMRALGQIR